MKYAIQRIGRTTGRIDWYAEVDPEWSSNEKLRCKMSMATARHIVEPLRANRDGYTYRIKSIRQD